MKWKSWLVSRAARGVAKFEFIQWSSTPKKGNGMKEEAWTAVQQLMKLIDGWSELTSWMEWSTNQRQLGGKPTFHLIQLTKPIGVLMDEMAVVWWASAASGHKLISLKMKWKGAIHSPQQAPSTLLSINWKLIEERELLSLLLVIVNGIDLFLFQKELNGIKIYYNSK